MSLTHWSSLDRQICIVSYSATIVSMQYLYSAPPPLPPPPAAPPPPPLPPPPPPPAPPPPLPPPPRETRL